MAPTPPAVNDPNSKSCPKCKRSGLIVLLFMSRKGDRVLKMCEKCRASSQNSHRRRRRQDAARRQMAAAALQKKTFEQIGDSNEPQNRAGDDHNHNHGHGGENGVPVVEAAPVVETEFLLFHHNAATFAPTSSLQAPASSFSLTGDWTPLPTFDHPSDDHFHPDYLVNRNLLDDSDEWLAAHWGFEIPPALTPAPVYAGNNGLPFTPVSRYAAADFHDDPAAGLSAGVAAYYSLQELSNYPVLTTELSVAVPPASPDHVAESYSGVDYDRQQAITERFTNPSVYADDAFQTSTFVDDDLEPLNSLVNSPGHADALQTPASVNHHQESHGSLGPLGYVDAALSPASVDQLPTPSSLDDYLAFNGPISPLGNVNAALSLASVNEVQTPSSLDEYQELLDSFVNSNGHADAFGAHAPLVSPHSGQDSGENRSTLTVTALAGAVDTVKTTVSVADPEFCLNQFPDFDFTEAVFDKEEEQMPKDRVCRYYRHQQDSAE
ncbi:hypothetical protein BJX68DRAFT_263870 [Aspergillus pseudodeflectus]|uniref:GATA-type domain-containing protein n=1 Tax=Aspergillus pseudodeflectus TaxID=176178 RepID=A0ABR4KVS8_9EURO